MKKEIVRMANLLCRGLGGPYFGEGETYEGLGFLAGIPIFPAILTSSGKESAPILRMSWLRWTFTVVSLVPSWAAICLLRRPEND